MSDTLDAIFSISTVTECFKNCSHEKLSIDHYCTAYDELYKFFCMLGSVFGFIGADVREKIDILRSARNIESKDREFYGHIERMMNHEIEVSKACGKPLLASRTLLRLHRALKFTMVFLKRLAHMEDHEKVSHVASNCYAETLANYHPWLIRKGASLAMYTLPTRKELLRKVVCANDLDQSAVASLIDQCVSAIEEVYSSVEDLYTKYDLHNLP